MGREGRLLALTRFFPIVLLPSGHIEYEIKDLSYVTIYLDLYICTIYTFTVHL